MISKTNTQSIARWTIWHHSKAHTKRRWVRNSWFTATDQSISAHLIPHHWELMEQTQAQSRMLFCRYVHQLNLLEIHPAKSNQTPGWGRGEEKKTVPDCSDWKASKCQSAINYRRATGFRINNRDLRFARPQFNDLLVETMADATQPWEGGEAEGGLPDDLCGWYSFIPIQSERMTREAWMQIMIAIHDIWWPQVHWGPVPRGISERARARSHFASLSGVGLHLWSDMCPRGKILRSMIPPALLYYRAGHSITNDERRNVWWNGTPDGGEFFWYGWRVDSAVKCSLPECFIGVHWRADKTVINLSANRARCY